VPILNSQQLLQLYEAGESEAATAIFDRYVTRLIALARTKIGQKLKRRVDAEDVVQSAYRSFFVRAKDGEYELAKSGDLWRLLASITLNKLYGQIERHTAAKRNVDREEAADFSVAQVNTCEPSPAQAVAMVEELQLVLNGLSPDEGLILTSTLQGQSIEEISRALGKSERTARRLLAEVKRKLEQRLLAEKPVSQATQRNVIRPHAPLRYSDYVLEQMLSSGGMGKVFRAREKHSGKQVAIKALHKARQSDDRAVAQFAQEAQILARLRHPNIVGIQGLGQFPSGGYFMVMDFVDGEDLQAHLRHGALTPTEVIRIAKDVATAVQYAHEQGVVHCDLKPGNVLLDKNGHVYVTDFGFAYLITGSSMSGHGLGGTAGYLAPEILLQQSRPTSAADVYAMGMLMWTLATGKSPNEFDFGEMMDEPLASVHSICRRCLAKNPNERYRSAKELFQVLDRLGSSI
jgi:RNA polymerase sigma factor (sigma-70 family)